MLPPVSATFRPRAEHPSPTPPAAAQPPANTANTAPVEAETLAGGRLDILALAGQLSLARGLSVLAETIGKLLKIDRQEGEPLADYAQRLAEAIRALSPADRAALERSLNQIVKGISLRLLAEILKNPAGPEAAQLSLRMELAQFLGRDLAARAVASSYRQNAGTTLLLGSPARPPSPIPPPATGSAATGSTTPSPTANAAGEARPPGAGAASSVDRASPVDIGAARGEKLLLQSQRVLGGASGGGDVEALKQRAMETSLQTKSASGAAQTVPARTGAAKPETAEAPPHSNEGNSPVRASGNGAAGITGEERITGKASAGARPPPPSSAVLYDAPALIRMSQRSAEPEQARHPQRVPYDPERLALTALTEWLTEALSGEGEARPLRAGAFPPQASSIDTPETQAHATPLADEEPAGRANRNPPTGENASDPMRRPAGLAEGAKGAKAGLPAMAELIAQQGAMLQQLAAAAIREGLALPYVAYPPAAEEPEAEEPTARQVDRTDEDGEQQSSGQGGFNRHDEETGQEEAGEGEGDPSVQEADAAVQAQDYYLRMAGWS